MFTQQTRISDIVRLYHQSAQIFEKYGIDFCCKGKRPLEDACVEKGLDLNLVMDEIRAVAKNNGGQNINFDNWSPSLISDYVVEQHHTFVRHNSPLILQHSARVAERHGDHQPQTIEIAELVAKVVSDMYDHMDKEEKILFPEIKKFKGKNLISEEKNSLRELINTLDAEHQDAGAIFERIRELSNNYNPPANACTTFRLLYAELDAYEKDLHQHVHIENNILFPKVLEEKKTADEALQMSL